MTDGGRGQGVDAGQRREAERLSSAWLGSLIQPYVFPGEVSSWRGLMFHPWHSKFSIISMIYS